MIDCDHGDVVLVNFVFSDESGVKRRPALVLSVPRYHQKRRETIVAAITSNVSRILFGDFKLNDWRQSGLLHPSVVTGVVRTIKQDMIHRKLGSASESDFQEVRQRLREVFDL
ncbi:MAG: type II toxin-antitoxin system PemK/MazF family toxin [Nitrospirota bacterium]